MSGSWTQPGNFSGLTRTNFEFSIWMDPENVQVCNEGFSIQKDMGVLRFPNPLGCKNIVTSLVMTSAMYSFGVMKVGFEEAESIMTLHFHHNITQKPPFNAKLHYKLLYGSFYLSK